MKYWREQHAVQQAIKVPLASRQSLEEGNRKQEVARSRHCRNVFSDWIYYVEVCNFKFAFFSLTVIDEYIDFFSRKVLPSSKKTPCSPYFEQQEPSFSEGYIPPESLPSYLHTHHSRTQVLQALRMAKEYFTR